MKSRYLFRGKQKDNGKWIVGSLCHGQRGAYIDYDEDFYEDNTITGTTFLKSGRYFEIDPATVGQCTGISADKSYRGCHYDDTLIFEGDILENKEKGIIVYITWQNGAYIMASKTYAYSKLGAETAPISLSLKPGWEIIGNIYDNPGLVNT